MDWDAATYDRVSDVQLTWAFLDDVRLKMTATAARSTRGSTAAPAGALPRT